MFGFPMVMRHEAAGFHNQLKAQVWTHNSRKHLPEPNGGEHAMHAHITS